MNRPTIDWNNANRTDGVVRFGGDEDLVVTFYWRSIHDVVKSREQSKPIFVNKQYVKIMRPGEMQNVVDRPVEQNDTIRFRRQWEAFQLQKTQVPEGSPIDLLFPNNPAVADMLRSRQVYTIQQLAHLTAHAMDTVGMGAQEYKNRAQEWLEASKSGENFIKYQEKIEKLEADLKTAQRLMAEQKVQIDALIKKISNPDPTAFRDEMGNNKAPFIEGYDAQSDRINSTHVTSDIVKQQQKRKPARPVADDINGDE